MTFFYIVVFFVGASLGSFVNATAMRLAVGEGINGRSYCRTCRRTLRWFELIPVFSYLAQMGSCRRCKARLSPRYVLAEVLLGLYAISLFFYVSNGILVTPLDSLFLRLGFLPYLLFTLYFLIGAALFFVALHDLDTKLVIVALPRTIAALGVTLLILQILFLPQIPRIEVYKIVLLSLLILAGFWLVSLATRGRGLGWGDAEVAFAVSLFLPFPLAILMVLFSFWSGALVAVSLLLFSGAGLKTQVPFAPFIVFGFFAALFGGNYLLPHILPLV
ncbi:MAG: prepilin peptidase [Candidatus Sungbacteria bacterium]|uniref:Prepilin peptidase n=1 Tax=Candidatus Sungiibacteriota bacterium TaxID=2750080 RepID=A0A9D6QTS0_9BACT|nr:prepilin peptidase [Candidatus Sungbacteria bacterium]